MPQKLKALTLLKKEEPKCYSLTSASLYLDFKLNSNRVCFKTKDGPESEEKIFRIEPGFGHARSFLLQNDGIMVRIQNTVKNYLKYDFL